MYKRIIILLVFCLCALGAAGAEGPFFFTIDGLRWHFAWGLDLIPTGVAATLGYRGWQLIPGVDTILFTSLDGGYEGFETYRAYDFTPHTLVSSSPSPDRNLEFNMASIRWELGIRQGLSWSDQTQADLLEAFLVYRGRYDDYLEGRVFWGTDPALRPGILSEHAQWKTDFLGTDGEGIFGTSLLMGMSVNSVSESEGILTQDGLYAEASLEFSPYFPNVPGAADFYRLNLSAKFFHTLFALPQLGDNNRLSIYLADYFSADWGDAEKSMPLYVMQSFGGTKLRFGLADSVRGFEAFSWDTQLKIVNNLELRINGPGIRSNKVVPGAIIYCDLGYGMRFWGDPSGKKGAWLSSLGTGFFVSLFDIEYVRIYVHFPLIGNRLDGEVFVLDINSGLHF